MSSIVIKANNNCKHANRKTVQKSDFVLAIKNSPPVWFRNYPADISPKFVSFDYRNVFKTNKETKVGVCDGYIIRLCKRYGAARIGKLAVEYFRVILGQFLYHMITNCETLASYRNKKTLTGQDLEFICKDVGINIYFDE